MGRGSSNDKARIITISLQISCFPSLIRNRKIRLFRKLLLENIVDPGNLYNRVKIQVELKIDEKNFKEVISYVYVKKDE